MLTKLLKFDDGVLDVIQRMTWNETGTIGTLPGVQLERKLYERVNKALEAMGGKWNRKAGGHVFATDPRPQVEGLLENGSLTVERDGFFETPRAVVERMLQAVELKDYHSVLEPSAGMGAIAKVLRERGARVDVCEKNHERANALLREGFEVVFCNDFMQLRYLAPLNEYDRVYMNPPFEEGQDIDHVREAYSFLKSGGAMAAIMSEGPFFRNDNKAQMFRRWLEKVGGFSERLPAGSFSESGTGVNTRMVVITK